MEPKIRLESVDSLTRGDLIDLCDATAAAITAGGGFGWLTPPPTETLEAYWKGVLVVPERHLFVARLDGVIAASAQLLRPQKNNEAQAFAASLMTFFVAPWARGYGLAKELVRTVEEAAREAGFTVLNLDVRETQTAAIALYESSGYVRWGHHPRYAFVDKRYISGFFYSKDLTVAGPGADP